MTNQLNKDIQTLRKFLKILKFQPQGNRMYLSNWFLSNYFFTHNNDLQKTMDSLKLFVRRIQLQTVLEKQFQYKIGKQLFQFIENL